MDPSSAGILLKRSDPVCAPGDRGNVHSRTLAGLHFRDSIQGASVPPTSAAGHDSGSRRNEERLADPCRCRRPSRQRSRRSSIVSGQTASSRGRRGWCPSTSSRRRRAPRSSRGRCHGGSTISPRRSGSAGPAHASAHRADVDGPRRGADGGRVPHRRARVHPAVGANGARHPSGIRAPLVGEMVDADRHDDGGDSRLAQDVSWRNCTGAHVGAPLPFSWFILIEPMARSQKRSAADRRRKHRTAPSFRPLYHPQTGKSRCRAS